MNMTKEWANSLADKGIKFVETEDKIIFYDPQEHPNHVVIRQHIKSDVSDYYSKRIGKISFREFDKKFFA